MRERVALGREPPSLPPTNPNPNPDPDPDPNPNQRVGSACLWTEYVRNESALLLRAFPRAVAIADALWVGRHKRASWAQFRRALPVTEDDALAHAHADAHADADTMGEATVVEAAAEREAEAEAAEAAEASEGAPCVSTSLKSYLEGPYHPHRAADGDVESFWWAEG